MAGVARPKRIQLFQAGKRPAPPALLQDSQRLTEEFEPARDLMEWQRRAFLEKESPLFNPDHAHLQQAEIGVLWTNIANSKQMRAIAGTAEIPNVQGPTWTKKRMEWQLRAWFGAVPDFLITLDAVYAASCDDASFAALVEHELYHCAQAVDVFGLPKVRQDGTPVWSIRGHDCEEFVGVVARYGAGKAAGGTLALVRAAQKAPSVAAADIASVCGTCLRAA